MKPIVITGAHGTLGQAFVRACEARSLACRPLGRGDLDITKVDAALRMLDRLEPWLVVNAAGYVRVDDAEGDAERCHRENAVGAAMLARSTAARSVQLVTFSSDLVFDGRRTTPYHEDDVPAPLGVYGRSKYEAEQQTLEAHPRALVVRTSAFFGPWDAHNFVTTALRTLASGAELRAACDATISPTYVPDLVEACLDLSIDGERGLWHLANLGATSWAELARTAARLAGYDENRVVPVEGRALGWRAPRPAYSALGSTRGAMLPSLAHALQRYLSVTPATS
jgi:dTDP-4-dehydrorhamnose reductase